MTPSGNVWRSRAIDCLARCQEEVFCRPFVIARSKRHAADEGREGSVGSGSLGATDDGQAASKRLLDHEGKSLSGAGKDENVGGTVEIG